jgi:hypothetical protein
MHPLVRGAAASALLFALSSLDPPPAPAPPVVVPPAGAARASGTPTAPREREPGAPVAGLIALCPERTLPEGSACVPLPGPTAAPDEPGAVPRSAGAQEHIPRRPDRPADTAAYRYPLGTPDRTPILLGAFELAPDGEQRPGTVDLAAARGDPVAAIALEGQEGDPEVAFVGELFGITVGTVHTVREGDRTQRYLVLHGHLERPGPGVVAGSRLRAGDTLGFAGDSGSPGLLHLRLDVRKVREGARLEQLAPRRFLDSAISIPCDPRNVLPRRAAAP